MQTNIGHSIQEYCKKINRGIDGTLILSLFIAFLIMAGFTIYHIYSNMDHKKPIVYKESFEDTFDISEVKTSIFASRLGETYTFSWCKGASRIKESNRIYFKTEAEAEISGRRLSKLCK